MKVNFQVHGSRQHLISFLVLLATVTVIYGGVMTHDFLPNWDDNEYVIANSAIRGFSLTNLNAAFSQYFVGNYSPPQMRKRLADKIPFLAAAAALNSQSIEAGGAGWGIMAVALLIPC